MGMNTQQSSHQRLAAFFAARGGTWDDLRHEAEARGVSVMEVVRARAEAEQAARQADSERVRVLVRNPAVQRALREGRLPTPDELALAHTPAAPQVAPRDPNAPPSAGRVISPAAPRR
jgi:hypothetical protein